MMESYDEILARFKKFGQDHVFAGWDKLFTDQRDELLESCAQVDFAWISARWKEFIDGENAFGSGKNLEPAPVVEIPKTDADKNLSREAFEAGEDFLRRGKAAAFLVAGGQGTRLGFEGPKGCYPIGPVSRRSLFQWHAEQIRARGARYGVSIPWYIMTSRENDRDTRVFFEEHGFFGLNKTDVVFFRQDMVPCLDLDGRLMLSSPSALAMNPTGHGGCIAALRRSGALKDMRKRGVEVVSYFQVDNPLVTVCDPLFLGWHLKAGSEMSSRVIEKTSPAERMGVACLRDGKPCVVEYIDMDEDLKRLADPDGKLKFWAGSPAIHTINVDFIERIASGPGLPWHQSRKKVPYFSGSRLIRPSAENAIKFETFVFDALPLAGKTLNLEVRREEQFAPVKNAEGTDSVVSCRELMSNRFRRWLAAAGVTESTLPGAAAGERPVVEISPLYSLDAGELAAKIKPNGLRLERFLLIG